MRFNKTLLNIIRIILDVGILIVSFILSAYLSKNDFNFFKNVNSQFLLLSLLIIWYFASKSTELYDDFRSRNFSHELVALIRNIFIMVIGAILVLFLLKEERLSRFFIILFSLTSLVVMSLEKYLFRRILIYLRKKGRNIRNLLIIGAGTIGRSFFYSVKENPHFGYNIIGFLDDRYQEFTDGRYLGQIKNLNDILIRYKVDEVIITLPNYAKEKIDDVIRICENHITRIKIIPDYFKFTSSKYNITFFDRFPIISIRDDRLNEFHWRLLKRAFDTLFTLLVFVFIFSWLFPIIIILQKILNPGPIFYSTIRWGRGGEKFVCYKFRTMIPQSDNVKDGKHQHTSKDDKRITPFGAILRKYNIDELPQFWNVLKGEISIVGPRPHDDKENMEIKDKINSYMYRYIIKPGITGWAQINGYRGGTSDISLMQKRIDYDIWYIENWSFMLDLQIIFMTISNMIKGDPNAY